jgi:dienelactone hydrolase
MARGGAIFFSVLISIACHVLATAGTAGTAATAATAGTPVQTGTFRNVTLPERSPLSTLEESFRRVPKRFTGQKMQRLADMSDEERAALDYDIAKETVDVIVPPTARDGGPVGLFVWLGVTAPDNQWFGVLAQRRLIYVTPNNCNGRSPWIKSGLAIDAVHNLGKQYNVDPKRVYLSGFSAGGHASAKLITEFPDVFRGALCLMGGHYYRPDYGNPERGQQPTRQATVLGPKWVGDVDQIKRDLRLVSVFGATDDIVPAAQGRIDHECLRLDGFQHVYFELGGHGHAHPDVVTFRNALAALEANPTPPPATGPTREGQRPLPDQIAQARRLLTTARMGYDAVSRTTAVKGGIGRLRDLAANDETYDTELARRCLTQILADYPTTPAAAEARSLLQKLDALPTSAPSK